MMKRRKFILLSSVVGTAVVLKAYAVVDTELKPEFLSEANSLDRIWDSKTLKNIGIQYRALQPIENISETLMSSIGGDLSNEVSVMLELEKRITEDFKTDQTLILDGWVISVTEARQCALYSTLIT